MKAAPFVTKDLIPTLSLLGSICLVKSF
nr:unnamed protein product [Callosobruchus analis]